MPKPPKADALPASADATAFITHHLDAPEDDTFPIESGDPRIPSGMHASGGMRGRLLPDGRLFILDLPPATQALFYPDLPLPPEASPASLPAEVPPPPSVEEL